MKYEALPTFGENASKRYLIHLASYPESRSVKLSSDDPAAEALTRSCFESAVVFSSCEGYCVPNEGRVCFQVATRRWSTWYVMRQLGLRKPEGSTLSFGESNEEASAIETHSLTWRMRFRSGDVVAELSLTPDALLEAISEGHGSPGRAPLRLNLTGLPFTSIAELCECATEIANSIFFHLDATSRVVLRIAPRRSTPRSAPSLRPKPARADVALKGLVDADPTAFYMYGRSADELPLVQYLALYQVMEYYFPMYAERLRCRRLSQILRNPRFDAFSDKDITRAVQSVIGSGAARGPSERHQLQAVLQACINEEDLRAILAENEQIRIAVGKKDGLSRHRLNLKNEQTGILDQVAFRVYDIRCRIVHTKLPEEDADSLPPLMPYSKEANEMTGDLLLMRYLAQQTIAANIRPFA